MIKKFNIYMTGVGGQGIGLLSEAILLACHHAKINAIGVDTHGLAQRGGVVESFLRIGENVFSPLIEEQDADMVIALERHEALRGGDKYLKNEGVLVYYDTVWQPLEVRLSKAKEIKTSDIENFSKQINAKLYRVFNPTLPDIRMQNMAILKEIATQKLIPGVLKEHYLLAIQDLLKGEALIQNMEFFN